MVMCLLDVEQLLIREENALPSLTSGPTLELAASLNPHALVLVAEALHFLKLERLEFELLFGYLAD